MQSRGSARQLRCPRCFLAEQVRDHQARIEGESWGAMAGDCF